MFKYLTVIFLTVLCPSVKSAHVANDEQICGQWVSDDKELIVNIYKDANDFKAKIVWFKGTPDKPAYQWYDSKNPDPKLRNRKILGMNVLWNLKYSPDSNTWEDGIIYDSLHGHTWNASVNIDDQQLKVKGYWHVKFLGKTMTFNRCDNREANMLAAAK